MVFASDQRFAVAGFYKDINKPIEAYTTYPEGDSPVTSYANAPAAQLYGAEIEAQNFSRSVIYPARRSLRPVGP